MPGYRAIVYDFAKVTFDAAMKFCESDDAGMFVPGNAQLTKWLKEHVKEPVWSGQMKENFCVLINPKTGQSETSDCQRETVGFICMKETTLSLKNAHQLVKKFTANITATANQWPPTIWKQIKETLAHKE